MRVDDLLVEVRDSTQNRVGAITPDFLPGFTSVLRLNQLSTWSVSLPYGHPLSATLSTPGSGIIVSLNGDPILSGDMTWFQQIRSRDVPDGMIQFTGLDDSLLLRDRLAYPTPSTSDVTLQTSAYDTRTGLAEAVMKDFVNANMGASAPTERKTPWFLVADNYNRGASVTASARFDNLYELLQSLANASTLAGQPLGFDVIQNGNNLVFDVFAPTDRTKTIRLDIENNQLTETIYSVGQPKLTRAIVGGQGDLAARTFIERSSTTSLAAETAWGRRIEQFIDGRSSNDIAALATDGDDHLATDGTAQITASVKPTDDSTMRFGKDWFLGDLVSIVVNDFELAAVVSEMGISVQADGVYLQATVGEQKVMTFERQILERQSALLTRMNNLERYK